MTRRRPPKKRSSSTWPGPGSRITFLAEYGLEDPVLAEIAEIVHDADLMDEKYGRPESEGLDSIIRGMQLALPGDEALIYHTDVLYDGLYAYLRREML